MIVCPSCRTANPEEATACSRCGGSLEPGQMLLRPARREPAARLPIEVPTPKPPSPVRPWVVLGLGLLGAILGAALWLLRPDPCREATFVSEQFGYCVVTPEGWVAGRAQVGDVQLDQFQVPSAATTVFVGAVDLTEGTDLAGFGELVRRRDEEAGLVPGPIRETRLGGVLAQQWDVEVDAPGGSYVMREVVAVRGEVGYRITLSAASDDFAVHAEDLRRMLSSWRFR